MRSGSVVDKEKEVCRESVGEVDKLVGKFIVLSHCMAGERPMEDTASPPSSDGLLASIFIGWECRISSPAPAGAATLWGWATDFGALWFVGEGIPRPRPW